MSSTRSSARGSRLIARASAGALVVGAAVALLALPGSSAPAPSPAAAASATVAITQFPVQGMCVYLADSFGLPRSGGRIHQGIDIMPKSNKPGDFIYAVADGQLTGQFFAAREPLAGNGWKLELPDGTFFYYFHMSAFAPGLTTGSKVVTGQILGQVGETGNAGGPHLHFEVHPGGGAAVDPYPTVHAVDGCNTTVVPPQPAGTFDPGLQPAVRLSLLD